MQLAKRSQAPCLIVAAWIIGDHHATTLGDRDGNGFKVGEIGADAGSWDCWHGTTPQGWPSSEIYQLEDLGRLVIALASTWAKCVLMLSGR